MGDGVTVKVEGFAELERKLRRIGGPQAEQKLRAANQQNADEFRALVAQIVPRGDDRGGHLAGTLKTYSSGPMAVSVSIGDASHTYPMHLEGGHRNPDGSMSPPKPFWNPAKRVLAKRSKARARRVGNALVKAAVAGGG